MLLTVSGTEASGTTYEAESSSNTRAGTAADATCASCPGGSLVGWIGNGPASTLTFNNVNASASDVKLALVSYVNGDNTARTATLQVNGQQSTVVSFPPTGSWTTPRHRLRAGRCGQGLQHHRNVPLDNRRPHPPPSRAAQPPSP